jgi:hypothetical protein
MDETAKQEYEAREEKMRELDALLFSATQGVTSSCHCTTCRMPFDPTAPSRRTCSIIQPSGLTCQHAGPYSELSCGCNVTQCAVCGEWLCPSCVDLHTAMDEMRCGFWPGVGSHEEIACHKLPTHATYSNGEFAFAADCDWKECDDRGMFMCPGCFIRFQRVNECYCDSYYDTDDCECWFGYHPAYESAKKKAERVRQRLKTELPDFRTQQLLCYGNVIANAPGNKLQIDDGGSHGRWGGRQQLGADVLESCAEIEKKIVSKYDRGA